MYVCYVRHATAHPQQTQYDIAKRMSITFLKEDLKTSLQTF